MNDLINNHISDNTPNHIYNVQNKEHPFCSEYIPMYDNEYFSETIYNNNNTHLNKCCNIYQEEENMINSFLLKKSSFNKYCDKSNNSLKRKFTDLSKDKEKRIFCMICKNMNTNVLMKKKGKDEWYHVCCLYYNNITRNNCIYHIYVEHFFFNHYNEDYFVNMFGSLKYINEIIIKKIKDELLKNYNILAHSHFFNFLMNPYYYNLTFKQIKNLIFSNFILNNNTLYSNYQSLSYQSLNQTRRKRIEESRSISQGNHNEIYGASIKCAQNGVRDNKLDGNHDNDKKDDNKKDGDKKDDDKKGDDKYDDGDDKYHDDDNKYDDDDDIYDDDDDFNFDHDSETSKRLSNYDSLLKDKKKRIHIKKRRYIEVF